MNKNKQRKTTKTIIIIGILALSLIGLYSTFIQFKPKILTGLIDLAANQETRKKFELETEKVNTQVCESVNLKNLGNTPIKQNIVIDDLIFDFSIALEHMEQSSIKAYEEYFSTNKYKYFRQWEEIMITRFGADFYNEHIKPTRVIISDMAGWHTPDAKKPLYLLIVMYIDYEIVFPKSSELNAKFSDTFVLYRDMVVGNEIDVTTAIENHDICNDSKLSSLVWKEEIVSAVSNIQDQRHYITQLKESCDPVFDNILEKCENGKICSGCGRVDFSQYRGGAVFSCSQIIDPYSRSRETRVGTIDIVSDNLIKCEKYIPDPTIIE